MESKILQASKRIGIRHNVSLRVIDQSTGKVVQEHIGHNAATDTLLTGIGQFLTGDAVLKQGYHMLLDYIPQYISLGTMGLINQEEDSKGLPLGIGVTDYKNECYRILSDADLVRLGKKVQYENGIGYIVDIKTGEKINCTSNCSSCFQFNKNNCVQYSTTPRYLTLDCQILDKDIEVLRYIDYMVQCPGYGADGYDPNLNNNREYMGLGPAFANREDKTKTVKCELISDSFPRAIISFRQVVPELRSELPQTIDVIFSAMISTGALAQFREKIKSEAKPDDPNSECNCNCKCKCDCCGNGDDDIGVTVNGEQTRDYIFITEAGLWSKKDYIEGSRNGLLAGYRIAPPDFENWDMADPNNRETLRENILRVGRNQVVQVIWKIQLGAIDQLAGIETLYADKWNLNWIEVDN